MSLRLKLVLYLLGIHLVFAGVSGYLLIDEKPWLLALELFFLLSFLAGARLVHHLRVPLDLTGTGAELIGERDFTSKFIEVGQPEMDRLVDVYNRMIDQLREERTRLEEQHYFMDKILAASPSGIVTLDFDGRIALANPAAEGLLGLAGGEAAGRGLDELGTAFGRSLQALDVGGSEVLPVQGRRVLCRKSQFLDQGFPRHFILMEELTEELRLSEKAAYEKVIRLLSHEVNNSTGAVNSLLHSCLNYKDQLREDDRGDFENALRVASGRIDHLSAFMRSYAEVVRLPAPRPRPVDLEALLRGIGLLMRAECEERRIEWDWDVQEALAPVAMDEGQMEQVFVNILRNAVEAIGEDGRITIRLGVEERPFAVIEDTGPGIGPEVAESLFTPFFSTKENRRGLGLTLVQEILGQHGFAFSLESPAGGPTRFAIRF